MKGLSKTAKNMAKANTPIYLTTTPMKDSG